MKIKKYLKNKYFIPSLVFIVFIFFFGIMTMRTEYIKIFQSVNKDSNVNNNDLNKTVVNFHKRLTTAVDIAFTKDLYDSKYFIEVYSITQNLLGSKIIDDAGVGAVVVDNHGLLHFTEKRYDVAPCADRFLKLAKEIKDNDIPLVYIQAPNKKIKNYTVFPEGIDNYSNDNADDFLTILKENNIDCIDLRDELIKDELNLSSLFYKTDHHWTTPTAFWAFRKTVDILNERYDMNLDSGYFYRDISNYETTVYKEYFLGSQGRRVGDYIVGLDDYTLILPKFDTDYIIYDSNESEEQPIVQGRFEESIVNQDLVNSNDTSNDHYSAYFGSDYGHLTVKNNLIEGKRIVIVKDSFALPYSAFLSTCVSEIQMIDMRDFTKLSLSQYIKEYKPDIVIFLYNTEVFSEETMFNF